MIKVKVIQASQSFWTGQKIYTLELEYPRYIHAQLMTHRVFSRNSSSSRAIPVNKNIQNILDNPVHIEWSKNQPGMQGNILDPNSDLYKYANKIHDQLFEKIVHGVNLLADMGIHKQNINRYLEPFQNIKVVLTATEFDNFFELRCHEDAQHEIDTLANRIKSAVDSTEPMIISEKEWHVPYVDRLRDPDGNLFYYDDLSNNLHPYEALRISASCCAQVSYRNNDTSLDKANKIFERLIQSEPRHCYDINTEVLTDKGFKYFKDITYSDKLADINKYTGELVGFTEPLDIIQSNYTGNMYHISNNSVSFCVTENHSMIGTFGKNSRNKDASLEVRKCNEILRKKPYILMQSRMLTAPITNNIKNPIGQLIGFYIGDGYKIDSTIGFNLKKPRKIKYIENTLNKIGLGYSINKLPSGTTHIRVYKCSLTETILTTCKHYSNNKEIGTWDTYLLKGIFDGLKNSDGSIKRNTWCFSTTSKKLKKDFLNLGPIVGLTISENKKQNGAFKLMVKTRNSILLNDSRNKDSFVKSTFVKNIPVFCATMPSGALLVKRNNKTLVCGNSSPFEHQAKPLRKPLSLTHPDTWPEGVTHTDKEHNLWSGNFKNWIQHRHLLLPS